MHARVQLYADARPVFYPVTRFLSPRPGEQTDGCALIKSCCAQQQKSDLPAPISHPVFYFFLISFTVVDSHRCKGRALFSFFVSNVHTSSGTSDTDAHTHKPPSLAHSRTPSHLPFVPQENRNGRELSSSGAVQIPATGLTHVAGQTKRDEQRGDDSRSPPPG